MERPNAGLLALALRIVVPAVDVHRARTLKAWHAVTCQAVEPLVANLQATHLVYQHTRQCGDACEEASAMTGQRCGPPRQQPPDGGLPSATWAGHVPSQASKPTPTQYWLTSKRGGGS